MLGWGSLSSNASLLKNSVIDLGLVILKLFRAYLFVVYLSHWVSKQIIQNKSIPSTRIGHPINKTIRFDL